MERHELNMPAPLLFVASDRREAEPWVSRWSESRTINLPVYWARSGKWKGRDVIAIANGVGTGRAALAVQAARAVTENFSGLCSIGTGGALDSSLRIADVVVATTVASESNTWPALDPNGPACRKGPIVTSPQIARTSAEKRNLSASGAILVEMEAAALARCATELAVPFYCVRAVSDLADETFFLDFQSFLMSDGRFNVPGLVIRALAHPVKGMGELLRLQRRSLAAARQLGDYLSMCKF